VTDFEQLYKGLEALVVVVEEVEDHLEEAHLEVEDQSLPPLPKAQYKWLHLET